MRFYGEPKLSKPKELKGIKQSFSIDYIPKKCRCQCFIKDDDVWVKHKDYFSSTIKPESHEIGMPLNYFAEKHLGKNRPAKFIYEDAWGSVIARNEAWIVLEGLIIDIMNEAFPPDILNNILRQKERLYGFDEYELCCTDTERFYEGVIREIRKYCGI